jgi:4-amino-4-deoxy-L-arabinose transferase-like glycosyltransferase
MKLSLKLAATNWWSSIERQPKLAWVFSVAWLLLLSLVAFLWNLGSIGLVDKTEPMFVEAARQMVATGDWITPYWNGETRFDKPPLVYWLMAIAFKLIGINEWAARLPSAIAAIALTGLGFYTLRCFGIARPAIAIDSAHSDREDINTIPTPKSQPPNRDRQLWLSAWIGSAILALNPAWIAWGRTAVSDMLLASCMSMALLAFFLGYAQAERESNVNDVGSLPNPISSAGWYIAFYIFAALAVLAKGPVGIVLPVLIIGAFLIYVGKFWDVFWEMRPLLGSLLFLLIVLPWFVLVTLANGQAYIDTFFGLHNVQRFTSVVSHHAGPWYFYFPVVLVGFVPWSIYLPFAIARLRFWRRERWRVSPRSTHLGLFALFWFAGVFGFFSIAVTKLPSYVLPLMPASAILVTLLWSDWMIREDGGDGAMGKVSPVVNSSPRLLKQNIGLLVSGIVNVVVLLALAVASAYSPNLVGDDPAVPEMSQALARSGLPIQAGIIWGAAAIASALLLLKPQQWRWLWATNLAGIMAFTSIVAPPAALLIDTQRQLPLRQLSGLITQTIHPGEELIMLGFIRPSVIFYTRRNVTHISSPESLRSHLERRATTQPRALSVLVLSKSRDLQRSGLVPSEYTNLGRAGAYQLIRIPKQVIAKN